MPYYESMGNDDPALVVQLVDTAATDYDITTILGAAPYEGEARGGDSMGDNMDAVIVTPDNDITGNENNNFIYGGAGDNNIDGAGGNDLISVGTYDATTHTFTLGAMSTGDTIHGGSGDDTLQFDGAGSTIDLSNVTSIEHLVLGSSAVAIAAFTDITDSADDILDVDGRLSAGLTFYGNNDNYSRFYLEGGSGKDFLRGNDRADTMFGGLGDDTLEGLDGNDTLSGTGGGDESILGGAGNDQIFMGSQLDANDVIDGGSGNDTLYYTDNNASTISELSNVTGVEMIIFGDADTRVYPSGDMTASGGIVSMDSTNVSSSHTFYVNTGSATNTKFNYTGGDADEMFYASDLADTLSGGAGNDNLNGKIGDDSLDGGSGNDTLYGLEGNDYIIGGTGGDTLNGGDGDDYLNGGAGADYLPGDAGNDTLVFNTGDVVAGEIIRGGDVAGVDRIVVETSTDFTSASELSGIEKVYLEDGTTATFTSDQLGNWNIYEIGRASCRERVFRAV